MAHDLQILQLHQAVSSDALTHPLCAEDGADECEAQKDDANLSSAATAMASQRFTARGS